MVDSLGEYFTDSLAEVKAKLDLLDAQLSSPEFTKDFTKPVIRTLWPTDLGLTNKVWSWSLTGSANSQILGVNIDLRTVPKKVIGIVGVYYPSSNPVFTEVIFKAGTADTMIKDYWHIENASALEKPFVLGKTNIIYRKDDVMHIYFYSTVANPSDTLVFLGRVLEEASANYTL